jgi:hypothetical protein
MSEIRNYDLIPNKINFEINKNINFYRERLESSFNQINNLRNNEHIFLDDFQLLLKNILKEGNKIFLNENLQNIKSQLHEYKDRNFNLLKILLVNIERDYINNQRYIEYIINELDSLEKQENLFKNQTQTNFDISNEKKIHLPINEDQEYYNINCIKNENNINNSLKISSEGFITLSIPSGDKSLEKENDPSRRNIFKQKNHSKSNRPNNNYLKDTNISENCSLCAISSHAKGIEFKKLGPMYGPFSGAKQKYYLHEMCAVYSPNIYIDKHNNKLKNVKYQIEKSKKIFCLSCNKPGASIRCCIKKCKKSYHYLCGKKEGCHFDNQSFDVNCSEHLEDKIYHEDLNSDIQCDVCNSGLDEDLLLLCSKCQRGCHTYCNQPKLSSVPEYDWFCSKCIDK